MHGEHSHVSFSENISYQFYFYHGMHIYTALSLHDELFIPKIMQTALAIFGSALLF